MEYPDQNSEDENCVKQVECDYLIVALGAEPKTELAEKSGIKLDKVQSKTVKTGQKLMEYLYR